MDNIKVESEFNYDEFQVFAQHQRLYYVVVKFYKYLKKQKNHKILSDEQKKSYEYMFEKLHRDLQEGAIKLDYYS